MTGSMRWWFVAFVTAVFLAGASVGVIVDRRWLLPARAGMDRPLAVAGPGNRRSPQEQNMERVVDVNMLRLRSRLELTAGQAEAVRPIVEAWQQRVAALQSTTRERLLAETQQFETQLSGLLTPEQRERLSAVRGDLLVPSTLGRGGRGGPGRSGPGRPGRQGRE
jgi:hypothetical protein